MRVESDRAPFVDYVRRAESAGYSSICAGDHLDDRGAPFVLLAAAAMASDRIGLAVHVLCNELRNPAVVAHECRTLQAIASGRLELGLGVGWLAHDFDEAGVEMAPFGERLGRLADTVERVRRVTRVEGLTPPMVTVGGGGPRMLALAARVADIVTINIPLRSDAGLASNTVASGTAEAFEERVAGVRRAASDAGRQVELHAYVHNVHLGESWKVDAADAARAIGLDLDDYLASPHVLAGDTDRIASTLVERRDEYGLGYVSIPGQHVDTFAPVLRALG